MRNCLIGLATIMLFLFTTTCVSRAALVQWSVSEGGNGHWYELVMDGAAVQWQVAEDYAVGKGGHLVTINSAEEETWLRNTFGGSTQFWIGFNDLQTEGTWVWSSGEPVTYTHWHPGQPDNSGDEDCAILNWYIYNGAWNDWDPTLHEIQGIAEYNAVPIPGAVWLFGSGLAGLVGLIRKKNTLTSA